MELELTRNTDPTRNGFWWTKERFYLFSKKPKPHVIRMGKLRVVWYSPVRFWFCSATWGDRSVGNDNGQFHSWQAYFGWGKIDATRCFMLWQGQLGGTDEQRERHKYYVATRTLAEMFAFRRRWVQQNIDSEEAWSNMGGI